MEEMSSVVERSSGPNAAHAWYGCTSECAESLRHQSEHFWRSAISGMAHEQVSWRSEISCSRILHGRKHYSAARPRIFEPGCRVVCGQRSRAFCQAEVWEHKYSAYSRENTMRVHLIVIVYLTAGIGVAQTPAGQIVPTVTTARVEDGSVTVLHLAPGYATSVRLPEEISSVVIGNPASFKAEHSEAEARLVFFKPTTSQPTESNALITTKSGQEISLHLVSAGKGSADARVDFLLEYRPPHSLVISPEKQTFLIADTRPLSSEAPANPEDVSIHRSPPDSVA